ncbi:PDDEXK nuclease domain-containing protein [Chitinophaga niabensis]|uniref:Predicted nuclease of restriction endonuclease-like (RecB) superfamily, DUF1016 family n=1 Tax=Chitinophaga niabensis TaxID=536979 RepID=A0A1N6KBJ4_9BACT|nr:PDDEXK nuclease domain-containing protein [Chitinophaga niabensis]SIO53969.1 Predicted nuclease of restriction endonuclease-like (RecB) superfamily, DUF1016 family [Chitinophaga niabensis]
MNKNLSKNEEYQQWLKALKNRVKQSQIKASLQVNYALLEFYWELGCQVLEKQKNAQWGDNLIPQLSKDLLIAFPGIKGFSKSNLFYIRKWVAFYHPQSKIPQVVGEIQSIDYEPFNETPIIPQLVGQIPWGHNREIITHCTTVDEALFYTRATISNNWSRAVLTANMESRLYERQGSAITNFETTLPNPQSDLARELLKNPYNFDFLDLEQDSLERNLENALVDQIQKFLLELGQGFAYMGRQFNITVGNSEFFLDLLFYHTKLRCYTIVEIKTVAFKPEFAGKLNFYLNAVDAQLKHPEDKPSIGILLCKTPDKVVVEYSLKNISNPLGVAEYNLTKNIPVNLQADLPTPEELALGLLPYIKKDDNGDNIK